MRFRAALLFCFLFLPIARANEMINLPDVLASAMSTSGSANQCWGMDPTGSFQEWITPSGGGAASPTVNSFVNPDFYLWTRGLSTTISNGSTSYQSDQWYVNNSLGPSGVITYSQNLTAVAPSVSAAQVQITTAPTSVQTNGTELYQPLSNQDSLPYYNGIASASLQVKALGNVSQVGLQFFYSTSEVKLTTPIGVESTCSVGSASFTLCSIPNVSMGTSMTAAGIVGLRIRVIAVSSGNTYDLNNGYIVSQAQMNPGATTSAFYLPPLQQVIARAQYFCYGLGAPPFGDSGAGIYNTMLSQGGGAAVATTLAYAPFTFPQIMRVAPTFVLAGAPGRLKITTPTIANLSASSTSLISSARNGAVISIGAAASMTAGEPVLMLTTYDNLGWIYFDAGI